MKSRYPGNIKLSSQLKSVAADPDTQISSYFIPRVSSEDAGYYQCVVSDEAGVIIYSNVIYLQVVDNCKFYSTFKCF